VKEDARAIVDEAAETPGVGFDGLDLGIEAFGNRVGDRMHEAGHDSAGQAACNVVKTTGNRPAKP